MHSLSTKILGTKNIDLLTFCPQIFCQACVYQITKVFPKEICFSSACIMIVRKKKLGAANVDLGLVISPEGVAN